MPFASALLTTCLHSAWFLLARALIVWSWVNCIACVCSSVGCCCGGGGGGAAFDGTAGSVASCFSADRWAVGSPVSAASPLEASVDLDFLGAV